MAKQYSVTTNMLTTDETVMIDGKVSFSRISRKMNAKEIEAENERRRANGNKMSPIDPNKPYSYIELYDVSVRTQNPTPRLIETYIREHCYVTPKSKTHPNSNCFMAKNSGNGVPTLCILQPDGVNTVQDYLAEGEELAAGLQVSILCKVFDSKNSPNKGLALETVIITDPRGLVLYERAATAEAMAAYGYTYTETPKPAAPAPQMPQEQPAQAVQPQMPQQQTAPQVQPQATNNFSYVPQGQPVAQPAPQVPQGQPVQVAQPQAAPQVQPQQFVPGNAMFTTPQQVVPAAQPMPTNNSAFMAPPTQAAQTQAAPQATVPQGQPVPQGTGINYDPNDNRTY